MIRFSNDIQRLLPFSPAYYRPIELALLSSRSHTHSHTLAQLDNRHPTLCRCTSDPCFLLPHTKTNRTLSGKSYRYFEQAHRSPYSTGTDVALRCSSRSAYSSFCVVCVSVLCIVRVVQRILKSEGSTYTAPLLHRFIVLPSSSLSLPLCLDPLLTTTDRSIHRRNL